jgi:PHD/YefM family antitoxin component YafN of YafNO toxin-antitoxin module
MMQADYVGMVTTEVRDTKSPLYGVLKAALENDVQTVKIREGNVVIVSEEEWNSMKETLYLSGVPGLLEDVLETDNAPESELIRWKSDDL